MRDKIKKFFLESNHCFISGEELSSQLNITRAAVWKQIEELKKEGYKFEAVRKKGYKLLNTPDDLFPEIISQHIDTIWAGKKVLHFKEIDSTQKEAHDLAKNGAEHGTIVIADSQTNGKGRLGRTWVSEKGKGIWLSIILRPPFGYQDAPLITLVTSTVIYRTLKKLYNIDVNIKWPNDIYINQKKCAGILTEIHGEQDKIHYMIIGIGMNIHQTDYPEEIQNKAISLEEALGRELRRIDILKVFLEIFEKDFERFVKEHFEPFYDLYNQHLLWKGEETIITNNNNKIYGLLKGINENGNLLLSDKNDQMIKIVSGEVEMK